MANIERVFAMNPGNEIRDKHPEKVALLRRHLTAVFGAPLAESEEFETDCLLFRTPSLGFVVVPDDVLDDYTTQQIADEFEKPRLTERIKALATGERLTIDPVGL